MLTLSSFWGCTSAILVPILITWKTCRGKTGIFSFICNREINVLFPRFCSDVVFNLLIFDGNRFECWIRFIIIQWMHWPSHSSCVDLHPQCLSCISVSAFCSRLLEHRQKHQTWSQNWYLGLTQNRNVLKQFYQDILSSA